MFSRKPVVSSSLISLANAIEARDPYTAGHTWRVSRYAVAMARDLGLSPRALNHVEIGAILHDLGKVSIADAVLHKPDKLSDVEFAMMKGHPRVGYRIVKSERLYQPYQGMIEHHHERVDGKGYPDGLSGAEIPVEARLLAIADTFDAMTSHRPYRKALPPETALKELDACRNTQFDSQLVDSFLRVWESGCVTGIVLHSADGYALEACPEHGQVVPVNPVSKSLAESGCPVCMLALNGLM